MFVRRGACWGHAKRPLLERDDVGAWRSSKTVQRTTLRMEDKRLLAVYRRNGSSYPLRYAPVYLVEVTSDTKGRLTGQPRPPRLDTGVHESFLATPFESSVTDGLSTWPNAVASNLRSLHSSAA
jgi:hypothetical protein